MGLSIVSKTHMRKSVLNIQNCERRIRSELGWFRYPMCSLLEKRKREMVPLLPPRASCAGVVWG